jgi:hypothetical protein
MSDRARAGVAPGSDRLATRASAEGIDETLSIRRLTADETHPDGG